ncbi:MAG: T9SS type A sorting domain-containing protein [Bacteroidota bacterium]|nr:T9SS type A sorting domain-containing protein [Bacteroidota bacterium]
MGNFTFSTKYKLQGLLLVLSIFLCNINSFALDNWNGSQRGPAPALSGSTYTITRCRELAWFADQVNGGNTFSGYTIVLGDDLNLANYSWTPIGNNTHPFSGTFNGQLRTVYNLNVSNSGSSYAGLFGYIGNNASISNTYLSGVAVLGASYVGSLVGCTGDNISITNCSAVNGSVTANVNYAGGLIGYSQDGVVKNSFSSCNVLSPGAASVAGGFVGSIYKTSSSATTFINCYSTGYVTSTGYCGGFIGSMDGDSPSFTGDIINCYATGPVLFYNYNTTTGGYGGAFVGNISNKSNVVNCFATGSVYGFTKNGGFVGSTNGNPTFVHCYFDIQGTGTTVGIGRGSGQDNQKYSLYGLSTSEITTASVVSGYLDNTDYGTGVWSFNNGYYPELTNFKAGSSGYTVSSPAVIVPALTPTAEQKAWSSLSATPEFFTDPDKSINVANTITAPLTTSPAISTSLTWDGNPRSGDKGALAFNTSSGVETMIPILNGNYNYQATDGAGRIKPYFVHINQTKAYFVRSYSGVDDGTDGTGLYHDGKTWAKAFKTVQYAVEKAKMQTPKFLVCVAAGNYNYNASYPYATGENFRMCGGVDVYGSFKEDSTLNNGYAGMDTRFASGYSVLNGSATRSVLAPDSVDYKKNTTWDGFYMTGCSTSGYAAIVPGKGWLLNAVLRNNNAALNLLNRSKAVNILVANNNNAANAAVAMADTAKLVNATIVYNSGPAIAVSGTLKPTVTNSILWGNSSNFYASGDTAKIVVKYSALSGAPDLGGKWITFGNSNGNINLYHRSPNFKEPGKCNYELSLISPCLDMGDITQNTTNIDVRGKDRYYYGSTTTIDMGAYQKQPSDGIVVTGNNSFAYFRSSLITPTISSLTGSEVLVTPAATLDASGSSPTPKVLMLQDNNIKAPVVKGTMTADSILYVRSFTKYCSNGITLMWNPFAIPFSSFKLDKLDGLKIENSVRIEQYDEATRARTGMTKDAWKPYLGSDWNNTSLSYFASGRGYMAAVNSKVPNNVVCNTLIVPAQKGTVITDAPNLVSIPVTRTVLTHGWGEEGWNFVANPFYQTATFADNPGNWPSNSDFTPVYMYLPEYNMYDVILLSDFNARGLSAFSTAFIKASVNTQCQMQTSSLSSPMRVIQFKQPDVKPSTFRLQIANQSGRNTAYVIFANGTHSEGVDNEDTPSLEDVNANALGITTNASGSSVALAVNAMPFVGTRMEVPMSVKLPGGGSYILSLPEGDDSTSVKIIESNGVEHSLNNATYTITTDKETTFNYTLLFDRSRAAASQNGSLSNSEVLVSQNKENITITSSLNLNKIYVFTMQGQLIQTFSNGGTSVQFNLPTAGSYILKVITDKGIINKKIVCQ